MPPTLPRYASRLGIRSVAEKIPDVVVAGANVYLIFELTDVAEMLAETMVCGLIHEMVGRGQPKRSFKLSPEFREFYWFLLV